MVKCNVYRSLLPKYMPHTNPSSPQNATYKLLPYIMPCKTLPLYVKPYPNPDLPQKAIYNSLILHATIFKLLSLHKLTTQLPFPYIKPYTTLFPISIFTAPGSSAVHLPDDKCTPPVLPICPSPLLYGLVIRYRERGGGATKWENCRSKTFCVPLLRQDKTRFCPYKKSGRKKF